jgi:hypothetical protein
MKTLLCIMALLSGSLLLAQNSAAANNEQKSNHSKGQVTVTGCVGQFGGDYTLTKQDPGITYELQATGKTRLHNYLGKRVEVTGNAAPTMSSSSDAMDKAGSAAPTTITINSIRIIDQDCSERDVSR